MPTTSFEGHAVLVTGGAMGSGRGIMDAFLAEGASVAIADIDGDAAARTAAAAPVDGGFMALGAWACGAGADG